MKLNFFKDRLRKQKFCNSRKEKKIPWAWNQAQIVRETETFEFSKVSLFVLKGILREGCGAVLIIMNFYGLKFVSEKHHILLVGL